MARVTSFIAAIAAAVILGGMQHEAEAQASGWICLPTFGGCDEFGGTIPVASAIVGLPFEWRLIARCNGGEWYAAAIEVQTGRLPPGLEIEPTLFRIVGVPTRAGSFSFQVLLRGISCSGSNYSEDYARPYTIVVTGN